MKTFHVKNFRRHKTWTLFNSIKRSKDYTDFSAIPFRYSFSNQDNEISTQNVLRLSVYSQSYFFICKTTSMLRDKITETLGFFWFFGGFFLELTENWILIKKTGPLSERYSFQTRRPWISPRKWIEMTLRNSFFKACNRKDWLQEWIRSRAIVSS